MTDNEIIKNFRNVVKQNKPIMLGQMFLEDVLDIINRQKAEIERLKGSVITNNIMETQRIKREAKSEAIKEFADRLCDGRVSNDPVVIAVKAELEMTEVQDDDKM